MDALSTSAWLRRQLCRLDTFRAARAGTTAMMLALASPAVVGAAGLGTEAAFWQMRQRSLQQLADMAAYAGAVELLAGATQNAVDSAARQSLESNGFRDDIGTATVETPPRSGPLAGASAVFVSVAETHPRYFSGLFLDADPVIRANATARVELSGQACVLALDPTASSAVAFSGNADVRLTGCSVMSNSSANDALVVSGSGALRASCAGAVGGVSAGNGMQLSDCPAPREHAAAIRDPYADVAEPAVSGPCKTPNTFGGGSGSTYSITGGRYCGMTISRTVTMAAGVYIIDGGELRINSTARVTGTGVTIFLTNGANLFINGSADIDLRAPTSGPYAGIVIFGRRSGTPVDHLLNGSAGSQFTGAIYLPNDRLDMRGSNSSALGCTQIIARTIDFRGNSGLGMDCSGVGVRDISTPGGVRLVL